MDRSPVKEARPPVSLALSPTLGVAAGGGEGEGVGSGRGGGAQAPEPSASRVCAPLSRLPSCRQRNPGGGGSSSPRRPAGALVTYFCVRSFLFFREEAGARSTP